MTDIPLQHVLWLVSIAATGGAAWAAVRAAARQARDDVRHLREEMARTLDATRKAMEALEKHLDEAYRRATRSHERIDKLVDEMGAFRKNLQVLDAQWQVWARTTQRIHGPEGS
jgi:DNA-binding XRE family transcriptional regulator